MCRPAPALSPTAIRPASSRNASTRRRLCSAPPRKPSALPARPVGGSEGSTGDVESIFDFGRDLPVGVVFFETGEDDVILRQQPVAIAKSDRVGVLRRL